MHSRWFFHCALLFLIFPVSCAALHAQGVCDAGNGALSTAQPSSMTPAEIIQRFAANEAAFKAARERYGYTLNVDIQTLNRDDEVDGEYRQISEITLDDSGKRAEKTTFAPLNTLRSVSLSQDDLDDIRQRLVFPLNPEELRLFSISYAGRQHVDQLETYVFDVAAKNTKEKKLFQGRIWVDDPDFVIVKTCGKTHADEVRNPSKKNAIVNVSPLFVTYREQVDGKFWFATYAHADEILRFPRGFVHIREAVKYSDYKTRAH